MFEQCVLINVHFIICQMFDIKIISFIVKTKLMCRDEVPTLLLKTNNY